VRRTSAIAGSAAFLALAPGTVALAIPYLLTGWSAREPSRPAQVAGGVLIAVSLPQLLRAFLRFVSEGHGTPAPIAPPAELVAGGIYAVVRNPMYVSVDGLIAGQALLLDQPVLWAYGIVAATAMALFVRLVEEPELRRRFGPAYDAYRERVPGWIPSLRRRRP
jgi:protein-S-isoprenylcysteine O-methyltransferase Ste14